MILNKKLIIIILSLFLAACEGSDVCYGENDYGNSGDNDTITVPAGTGSCSYNENESINLTSQSATVKQCLEGKNIKNISSNVLNELKNYSEKKCSNIERGNYLGIEFNDENITEEKKLSLTSELFRECVKVCQDACENSNDSNNKNKVWTSANLKGNDYIGIKLKKDTILNITVSGNVILDPVNEGENALFNKYGIEDADRGFFLGAGSVAEAYLKINKNLLPNGSDENKIKDFKSRTYLSLKSYEPSLANSAYDVQDPKYEVVRCKYDGKDKYYAYCTFDYSNIIDDSNFRSIVTNYFNKNYPSKTLVFNSKDYYLYASDAFNYVNYDSSNPTVTDEKKEDIKVDKYNGNNFQVLNSNKVDGYIWNDGKSEFKFIESGPFKIAIKNLGSASNCDYSFEFSDYDPYSTEAGGKVNKKYITNYGNNKNWYTIKNILKDTTNTDLSEVIFNRYSTLGNVNNNFVVTIKRQGSDENCSRGLAIKIIKLKDYYVYGSGFLSLSIPNTSANASNEIKYNLLNQDIFKINDKNVTAATKISEFFENNISLKYNSLRLANSSDLKAINSANQISSLKDRIIYVKEGQILRFDYSNWMELDGEDDIRLFETTSNNKDDANVEGNVSASPYLGVGLNAFIKESPLYLCYGTATESYSYENTCASKKGTFETFETESTEKAECYVPLDVCNISATKNNDDFLLHFKNITQSSNGTCTTFETLKNETKNEKEKETIKVFKYDDIKYDKYTISEFLVKQFLPLYNRTTESSGTYKDPSTNKETKVTLQATNKACYYKTIMDLYKKTAECYNKLIEGSTYNLYEGSVDEEYGFESSRSLIAEKSAKFKSPISVTISLQKHLSGNKYEENKNVSVQIVGNDGMTTDNYKNLDTCIGGSSFSITPDGSKVQVSYKCDKAVIEEAIRSALVNRMQELFYIKEATISGTDGAADTKIYTDHFYYYENICEKTSTGNCKEPNVTQCYDLTRYKGSFNKWLERIKKNVDNKTTGTDFETRVVNYGNLKDSDISLGAKKLLEFNGSYGLIKNFVDYLSDSERTLCKYSDTLSSDSPSNFSIYIINKAEGDNGIEKLSDFGNYGAGNIIEIEFDAIKSYQNGDRLAVIIGDAKNGDATNYYYSTLVGVEKIYKSNASDPKQFTMKDENLDKYYPVVMYDPKTKNLSKDSPYKFNSSGVLINSSDSTIGADFGKFNKNGAPAGMTLKDYMTDGTEKNLFFRIIDTDDLDSNNAGSYILKITTFNDSESKIITYFRDFFNKILGFINGGYVRLKVNQYGNKEFCEEKSNTKYCYIYDEKNVMRNGEGCKSDANNNNCYANCVKEKEEADEESRAMDCRYKDFYNGKGFVKNIFEMFINDNLYQFIAKIALVLTITIYGFSYFFGLSNFTQGEIMTRVIRFSFIYFIISPSGWNFFNNFVIKFFVDGIDSLLFLIASAFDTEIVSELTNAVANNDYSDKSLLFSTTFTNFEMIFSEQIFNKMLGLAFSSWFGLIYFYLVFSAVINYMVASLSAIIIYLSAQIYMSLVFCFFPLVVLFMFFERTKKTFDNWVNLLIGFAGQQLFLVMTLSFFNLLILTYIKSTFTYRVCLLPIFNLNIGGIPFASIIFWRIPTASFSDPIEKVNEGMPNFYSIIGFYVISVLMTKFITGMVEVGKTIFGGIGIEGGVAGTINKGINAAGMKAKDMMKNVETSFAKGMANRFLGGKAIEDYSKKQEKERKDRREARAEFHKGFKNDVEDRMKGYANSSKFKKAFNDRLEGDKQYNEAKKKFKNENSTAKEKKEALKDMNKASERVKNETLNDKRDQISGEVAMERIDNYINKVYGKGTAEKMSVKEKQEKAVGAGVADGRWFKTKDNGGNGKSQSDSKDKEEQIVTV